MAETEKVKHLKSTIEGLINSIIVDGEAQYQVLLEEYKELLKDAYRLANSVKTDDTDAVIMQGFSKQKIIRKYKEMYGQK